MRKYNSYRHRYYDISKTKAKEYASQMSAIREFFDNNKEWSLSSHGDSCYRYFDKYTIRLSNHSADNQYHDLSGKFDLLINIKCSKLDFVQIIQQKLDKIIKQINKLPLNKYRFINISNQHINCFYKEYKTKKDVYLLD